MSSSSGDPGSRKPELIHWLGARYLGVQMATCVYTPYFKPAFMQILMLEALYLTSSAITASTQLMSFLKL